MLYKHILVPTDGSALSRKAIRAAVGLARVLGARITALYVVPEGVPTLFSGDKLYGSGVLAPQYREAIRRAAEEALGFARESAAAAGVPCSSARTLARAVAGDRAHRPGARLRSHRDGVARQARARRFGKPDHEGGRAHAGAGPRLPISRVDLAQ
jgi:hypothetical protein